MLGMVLVGMVIANLVGWMLVFSNPIMPTRKSMVRLLPRPVVCFGCAYRELVVAKCR